MFPVCYSFLPITIIFHFSTYNVLNNVPKSSTLINLLPFLIDNVPICQIMFLPTDTEQNFKNTFWLKGTLLGEWEHDLRNIFQTVMALHLTNFLLFPIMCWIMFLPTENFRNIFRSKGTFFRRKGTLFGKWEHFYVI